MAGKTVTRPVAFSIWDGDRNGIEKKRLAQESGLERKAFERIYKSKECFESLIDRTLALTERPPGDVLSTQDVEQMVAEIGYEISLKKVQEYWGWFLEWKTRGVRPAGNGEQPEGGNGGIDVEPMLLRMWVPDFWSIPNRLKWERLDGMQSDQLGGRELRWEMQGGRVTRLWHDDAEITTLKRSIASLMASEFDNAELGSDYDSLQTRCSDYVDRAANQASDEWERLPPVTVAELDNYLSNGGTLSPDDDYASTAELLTIPRRLNADILEWQQRYRAARNQT